MAPASHLDIGINQKSHAHCDKKEEKGWPKCIEQIAVSYCDIRCSTEKDRKTAGTDKQEHT